jgi:hypothetical protein
VTITIALATCVLEALRDGRVAEKFRPWTWRVEADSMRSLMVLVALVTIGCTTKVTVDSDGGGGTGGTSQGSGSGGGDTPIDGCPDSGACQSTSCATPYQADRCAFEWTCLLDEPCEPVSFIDDYNNGGPTISLLTPEAATCVLEAMRDGTIGTYEWALQHPQSTGLFVDTYTVHIRPNRMALVSLFQQQDMTGSRSAGGPLALQHPTYLEACLAETDGEAIYYCLNGALTEQCNP